VPVIFTPILSVEQQAGDENRPQVYMNNIAGPLSNLQSNLHWYLHDLSRFHQVIINDLNKRNDDFDKRYKLFKEHLHEERPNISDEEGLEYLKYKVSQIECGFDDEKIVIDRCKAFSDEFSVIGMWATGEKYLGKVYAAIESYQTGSPINDISVPYRWDDIKSKLADKSILLEQLDGYADANECRVLNNAIKHAGFVTTRLSQFPFFTSLNGEELQKVDYDTQRYYNGISSFLGNLIQLGNRALDPKIPF